MNLDDHDDHDDLERRLRDSARTLDVALDATADRNDRARRDAGDARPRDRGARPTRRRFVAAAAAVIVVGAGIGIPLAREGGDGGGSGGSGADPTTATTLSAAAASTTTAPTTAPATTVSPTTVTTAAAPSHLDQPLGYGSSGEQVSAVQQRLSDLGFFVGPVDGQFGNLTKMAVWAFEKLVLQVPRSDATGVVTDEMWQFMQRPMRIAPRRLAAEGEATTNHTEVYLPEQVVAFFRDDVPVLISHMSSGTGREWREEVTIDVGEYGNENGSEPIVRGEIGVSITPGGVFDYDRMVEGLRQSALGGMWDPAYFNYGIAIHGALNVPLEPASHGCIRIPMNAGEVFHDYISLGDQVFVWDGIKEPEVYAQQPDAVYPRGQLPIFNRVDPDYVIVTTTTAPASTSAATTTSIG